MAKLKLTYFDFSGRAEPTRLTFVLGDVDFIDERINREGLEERKAAGTAPTGTIPTLEVDGELMCESSAILRYAGRLTGLYPMDPMRAFRVDEMISLGDELVWRLSQLESLSAADREIAIRETVKPKFDRILPYVEKRLTEVKGPYLLGEEPSIADLYLFTLFTVFLSKAPIDGVDAEIFAAAPSLQVIYNAVSAEPKVEAYYNAKRTRTGSD